MKLSLQALLVHGMARTPLSMMLLAKRLNHVGIQTRLFGYVAAMETCDRIVERLTKEIVHLAASGQPYMVIGHSLGGIFLRSALANLPFHIPLPAHLFMLGTPNRSPRLARHFQNFLLYRLINGESGQLLAQPEKLASIPKPKVPYTIIAGTLGVYGQWSPFGDELNDSVVAVSETILDEEVVPLTFPVVHTLMMNSKQIFKVIHDKSLEIDFKDKN